MIFFMILNTILTGIWYLCEKNKEVVVVKKFLQAVPLRFLQIVTFIEQFGYLKTMTMEEFVGCWKTHEERLQGYGVTPQNQ